jgi:hypothetical protein
MTMSDHGKRLSKSKLFDRSNPLYVACYVVSQIQGTETRRTMSIARFANSPDGEGGLRFCDVRLVWMNQH